MKEHSTDNLALATVVASPRPQISGDPRLWLVEALEVCPPATVARRLGCSDRVVRGWRTGASLPNLDHLARAPRAFTGRLLVLLGDHVRADALVRREPREALHQMTMALGALLVDLSRRPLDQMSPDEARDVAERAALIEEQAAALRRAAAEQARTVQAPAEDKGGR